MKVVQQQLTDIKQKWDAIASVPDDLTSWGYPGLTKQSISDEFGGMAIISGEIAKKKYTPLPISKAALNQYLTNLNTYMTTHIPQNPQGHLPGLIPIIENMRTSLRHLHEESDGKTRRIYGEMAERLALALSRVSDASKIYETIIETQKTVDETKQRVEVAAVTADGTISKIENVEKRINDQTTSMTASLKSLEGDVEKIKTDADKIGSMTSEFAGLSEELVANKASQETLFQEFEDYRKKVESILEKTNQAGLAKSFIARKNQLFLSLIIWGVVFFTSIGILLYFGNQIFDPSKTIADSLQMLPRLSLAAPVIWLGWFAAKQYGFATRIREDYAFKAATAMAFEGYKREAEEAGEDIKQKLLNTAVDNFGENPLRIFNNHANHASPTHELLETILKDNKLIKKLSDMVKQADD